MTDIQQLIRDGRELLERASPGRWEFERQTQDFARSPWLVHGEVVERVHDYATVVIARDVPETNASLMVYARNNLPALLDALEATQKENAFLRAADDERLLYQTRVYEQNSELTSLRAENGRLRQSRDLHEACAKELGREKVRLLEENRLLRRVADAAHHFSEMQETYEQDPVCDECRESRDDAYGALSDALGALPATTEGGGGGVQSEGLPGYYLGARRRGAVAGHLFVPRERGSRAAGVRGVRGCRRARIGLRLQWRRGVEMSKASRFAATLDSAQNIRPEQLKADGTWLAYVTDRGGVEFHFKEFSADKVPALLAWLNENFGEETP